MTTRLSPAPEIVEQKLTGQALKALRERANMTQQQAADAAGVTLTAWQNYEHGRRQWKSSLVTSTTGAVGATPEDLQLARAQITEGPEPRSGGTPGERPGRPFQIPIYGRARMGPLGFSVYDAGEPEGVVDLADLFGPNSRAIRGAGDSMYPYAEDGGFLVYRIDLWPIKGKGCVIETLDGQYYVKRYDKVDGSAIYVTELFPDERQLRFDLKDLKGVYRLTIRGD